MAPWPRHGRRAVPGPSSASTGIVQQGRHRPEAEPCLARTSRARTVPRGHSAGTRGAAAWHTVTRAVAQHMARGQCQPRGHDWVQWTQQWASGMAHGQRPVRSGHMPWHVEALLGWQAATSLVASHGTD